MIVAPIFELISNDLDLKAALLDSDGIIKAFQFGMGYHGVKPPYVVWQQVGGHPVNYIAGRPDIERQNLQVDAYGNSAKEARDILGRVELAVEQHAHVVRYNGENRDSETKAFRASVDVEWHLNRG